MQQISGNAYWMRSAVGARCYWLDGPGKRRAIIDPGTRFGLNRVARELGNAGRSPGEVTDILLTHYDFDHTAAAAEWQRRTGARVWLGAPDAAILGRTAPAPDTPLRRTLARFGLPELPAELHLLEAETEIWDGLIALPTPGHTPGHFSFLAGQVVFVGDAGAAVKGLLKPTPAPLMSDLQQGEQSLARLRKLQVEWYCCGHTDPVRRSSASAEVG